MLAIDQFVVGVCVCAEGGDSSVHARGRAGLRGVESLYPPKSNCGPAALTQNRNLDKACLLEQNQHQWSVLGTHQGGSSSLKGPLGSVSSIRWWVQTRGLPHKGEKGGLEKRRGLPVSLGMWGVEKALISKTDEMWSHLSLCVHEMGHINYTGYYYNYFCLLSIPSAWPCFGLGPPLSFLDPMLCYLCDAPHFFIKGGWDVPVLVLTLAESQKPFYLFTLPDLMAGKLIHTN